MLSTGTVFIFATRDGMDQSGNTCSTRVRVLTREGLHARPASQIVDMLSRHDARLTLVKDGEDQFRADCSSVLDMLILAAGFNSELSLFAEGPDAREALDEVSDFFARKFDQEEL